MINDKNTTCIFTGHRILPAGEQKKELQKRTENAIKKAYADGYRTFITGGAIGYDMMASLCVLNLRAGGELPGCRLVLALPHFAHQRKWSQKDIAVFANILQYADEVLYISEKYDTGCMHKRNRFMVDHATRCIAFCQNNRSGTAYTIHYAQKNGIEPINLALET